MVTEKELIAKIRELREIKPRKEWVFLTKNRILGEEKLESSRFFRIGEFFSGLFVQPRLIYASLTLLFIIFGLFGFAQNSLPGDLLYPIKKITEKSQAVFVSKEELPKLQLELANKRLEELNKIAQTNDVKKLAPAITEFQENVDRAVKSLVKSKKIDKELVEKTAMIEKTREEVEKVLGTNIGTEEYENSLAKIVESQLKDLENRSLTEEQKEILEKAKSDFENGDYSQALEKVLILSENK